MNVYAEFLYWGLLGLINLAVSILIYHSTKLERKQKLAAEYEVSTRPSSTVLFTLPSSFRYLSFATGLLNLGGAFLRFQRIQFLEIPIVPWLANIFGGTSAGDEFLELLEAKWLVAMNDWTSLFLASTFFLAGCLNFATVRQLKMRDRWVKEFLLPAYQPCFLDEKAVVYGGDFIVDDKPAVSPILAEEREGEGRSFAVFVPVCTKRLSI